MESPREVKLEPFDQYFKKMISNTKSKSPNNLSKLDKDLIKYYNKVNSPL
jgi:hypothetical protein